MKMLKLLHHIGLKFFYPIYYYVVVFLSNPLVIFGFISLSAMKMAATYIVGCSLTAGFENNCMIQHDFNSLNQEQKNALIYDAILEDLSISKLVKQETDYIDITRDFVHLVEKAVKEQGFDPNFRTRPDKYIQHKMSIGYFDGSAFDEWDCPPPYYHQSLIHVMALVGCTDCLSYLVDKHGADINQLDCRGRSVAHYTAMKVREDTLKYLLENEKFNKDLLNHEAHEGAYVIDYIELPVLSSLRKSIVTDPKKTRELLYSYGAMQMETMQMYSHCLYKAEKEVCAYDKKSDQTWCGYRKLKKEHGTYYWTARSEYDSHASLDYGVHVRDCSSAFLRFSHTCENYGKHCDKKEEVADILRNDYQLDDNVMMRYAKKQGHLNL